jgi:hypothetical protein
VLFPFLWQLIEGCIFAGINSLVASNPAFEVLLKNGEDLAAFAKLPPEEILLRWFNYHLRKAGSDKIVENFSGDIQVSCSSTLTLF